MRSWLLGRTLERWFIGHSRCAQPHMDPAFQDLPPLFADRLSRRIWRFGLILAVCVFLIGCIIAVEVAEIVSILLLVVTSVAIVLGTAALLPRDGVHLATVMTVVTPIGAVVVPVAVQRANSMRELLLEERLFRNASCLGTVALIIVYYIFVRWKPTRIWDHFRKIAKVYHLMRLIFTAIMHWHGPYTSYPPGHLSFGGAIIYNLIMLPFPFLLTLRFRERLAHITRASRITIRLADLPQANFFTESVQKAMTESPPPASLHAESLLKSLHAESPLRSVPVNNTRMVDSIVQGSACMSHSKTSSNSGADVLPYHGRRPRMPIASIASSSTDTEAEMTNSMYTCWESRNHSDETSFNNTRRKFHKFEESALVGRSLLKSENVFFEDKLSHAH